MPRILLIDTDDFLGAADFLSRQMARDDVAVNSTSIGPRKLEGRDVFFALCEVISAKSSWSDLAPEAVQHYERQARILNERAGL